MGRPVSPSSKSSLALLVGFASMSHNSEDVWNTAFSSVGREDEGEGRDSDHTARMIYTLCGIGPAWCKSYGVTGA